MVTLIGHASQPPKWLNKKEYPFQGHYFHLPVGKMHFLDEGKGEPIVMVHGNPGWSFEYRNIVKEMSATHRCIVPDLIGFGLSDKPFDWDYLPEQHAHNLELLLESLDLKDITLVVNDWGGPIGLSYALNHPERIKKIIVLNSWMWSVEHEPHFQNFSKMMGGSIGRFLIRNFNFFGKVIVKKAMADSSKLSNEVHKQYYMHMSTPKERKGCYVFPKQIIDSSKWLNSLWSRREAINQKPATFIWGLKDIAFREKDLNYWTTNWNGAKVIRLENAGHFPQEEQPQVLIYELKGSD
jgi:haloalkane dehalogenase